MVMGGVSEAESEDGKETTAAEEERERERERAHEPSFCFRDDVEEIASASSLRFRNNLLRCDCTASQSPLVTVSQEFVFVSS